MNMVATTFFVLACLILLLLAIGGVVALLALARQGDGVATARRNWIEGVEDPDES
jgi:hypothetical protein